MNRYANFQKYKDYFLLFSESFSKKFRKREEDLN